MIMIMSMSTGRTIVLIYEPLTSDLWPLTSVLCSLTSGLRTPWHAVVPRLPDEGGCPSARSNLSSHLPLWSYYDYNMVMELVGVAQLKSKLSHYLAAVKRGKEITITSHRHSIARIVPLDNTGADLKIIPARKPVSSLRKLKAVKLKVDLVADLLADRRRR